MSRRINPEQVAELRATGRAKDKVTADMADTLVDLQESTNRLALAVLGDEEAGHTGLVERVKQHGTRLDKLERLVLWGAGAGAVILFVLEAAGKSFTK